MFTKLKQFIKPVYRAIDKILRKYNKWYAQKRKYENELNHWRNELIHLKKWFVYDSSTWWGINPIPVSMKCLSSRTWVSNAVHTIHKLKPHYLEHLKIEPETLTGKVLDFGCGPISGILEFPFCEKHGVDPLINEYIKLGYPLYDYNVKFINSKGELMPFVDGYFDAIISVNALDHVDNFNLVAKEIQRCLKFSGKVYFEIEYHKAKNCEPQELNDDIVINAFDKCNMTKVLERNKAQAFNDVETRFGLSKILYDNLLHQEKVVVWHGTRVR